MIFVLNSRQGIQVFLNWQRGYINEEHGCEPVIQSHQDAQSRKAHKCNAHHHLGPSSRKKGSRHGIRSYSLHIVYGQGRFRRPSPAHLTAALRLDRWIDMILGKHNLTGVDSWASAGAPSAASVVHIFLAFGKPIKIQGGYLIR